MTSWLRAQAGTCEDNAQRDELADCCQRIDDDVEQLQHLHDEVWK